MLIENLLYSAIEQNDVDTVFKVKDRFLQIKEIKYIEFVRDFYTQYGKLPDRTTVESKFNITLNKNNEKADYWFQEILSSYKTILIEEAIKSSAKSKSKAPDIFQQALIDLNVDNETVVHSYADGKRRAQDYKTRKGTKGITYLSTGSDEIDSFSNGYKKADLWTIGGRESAGKSWFLLRMANWLDLILIKNNIKKPILIISGEMEAIELEERLDSIRCKISYLRLSKGELLSGEERRYLRYLDSAYSNIKIIDTFDGLKDIDRFAVIYQPAIIFIDGSHLLASSYDWVDIARVTANMKKMTRNRKIPVVNTTHLKADKGNTANGGGLDDFAYTKGYTRDSDIVGVMYASDIMTLNNQIGLDWVKVRRANRTQIVYENDHNNGTTKVISNVTGNQLALGGKNKKTGNPQNISGRNGQQVSDMYN